MFARFYNFIRSGWRFPYRWVQQALFWGGAVAIAVLAILFATISAFGYGFFAMALQGRPWVALIIVPAGFAVCVWLTQRFFYGAEGSGIPQTIAAIEAPEIADRASVLSLRVAFGKIALTTVGLCVGASVGREGPTVQVGAAIMHKLGKFLHLAEPRTRRAMILAGGAAGIAAAFNTPLAGILFAIEELSCSFEEKTSGTALTSVIVAGIVSMAALGNYAYFGHSNVALQLAQAWKPVLICGIVGGALGGGFSRMLIAFSKGVPGRVGRLISLRPVVFAGLCGLVLAAIGQFPGQPIFGSGYAEAKGLIEGTEHVSASFGVMKLLATAISYISGIPGGLFAPSLAVGAGIGSNIAAFLPDAPTAAVVILGMVGYFTGVVQVPITATIIVMEMTDDQSLTLPLLSTAFIAFGCSRLICPTPLYRTLAQTFLHGAKRRFERGDASRNPGISG